MTGGRPNGPFSSVGDHRVGWWPFRQLCPRPYCYARDLLNERPTRPGMASGELGLRPITAGVMARPERLLLSLSPCRARRVKVRAALTYELSKPSGLEEPLSFGGSGRNNRIDLLAGARYCARSYLLFVLRSGALQRLFKAFICWRSLSRARSECFAARNQMDVFQ